jgi:predicted GIY-YIG superfamily endonuclease
VVKTTETLLIDCPVFWSQASLTLKLPVSLVHLESFPSLTKAVARESQLKKWSHAKKEALIKNDFTELNHLSKSHD